MVAGFKLEPPAGFRQNPHAANPPASAQTHSAGPAGHEGRNSAQPHLIADIADRVPRWPVRRSIF
jgi:hypothetical protein